MKFQSIDPATGKHFSSFEEMENIEIAERAQLCEEAFHAWKTKTFSERAQVLGKVSETLRARKSELAKLMAHEMGKPLSQGVSETEKCASTCVFYAENAEKFLKDEPVESEAKKSYVSFPPLGVVLAIMPWNFPLWQVFRFAAPALMAGNGVLLKHAENVTACALEIEKIFADSGLPKNLFQTLIASRQKIETLIQNPIVKAVTLTGSTRAGKAVASNAGAFLKKVVLELGGSDPYLILENADLELAAQACVTSRMLNSGQSCIAAKRFIVDDRVADEFEKLFIDKMKKYKMGAPLDETVNLGPMARFDLRDQLHAQVEKTVSQGATLKLGGEIPNSPGAFYPATVLTSITPKMTAFNEETFGPVAAIIRAKNEAHAIELANHSIYGLGAAVFSRDLNRAEEVAKQIDVGCCFINDFVKSDPRFPFGGVKESGYGRELSEFGIREFVNIKTVWIKGS